MKKWILLGVAAVVLFLVFQYTDIGWKTISMLAAGLWGPFKLLFGGLGGNEEKIRQKHAEEGEREQVYQQELETGIQTREQNVAQYERKLTEINRKLAELDARRARVDLEVDSMSMTELRSATKEYFGF